MPHDPSQRAARTAWRWFSVACTVLAAVSVVAAQVYRPTRQALVALAITFAVAAWSFAVGHRHGGESGG